MLKRNWLIAAGIALGLGLALAAQAQYSEPGNQLSIEAWGNCQPKDCDWGGQTTSFDGQKASATWNFTQQKKSGKEENRVATLTITPINGSLQVTVDSTTASKPESQHQFTFTHSQQTSP